MRSISLAFGLVMLATFSRSALALTLTGTISVNTTGNADNAFDGKCALVEAMKAANMNGNYHECHVSGTGPLTVTLPTTATPITSNVAIAPNKPITIKGAGLTATTIAFSANTTSGCGVLAVDNDLTLQNLTIQQNSGLFLTGVCGKTSTGQAEPGITLLGVRVRSFLMGGVGMQAGGVSGTNVIIRDNHTPGNGGGIGIFTDGSMGTFTNLSLIGNFADGFGGGLYREGWSNGNIINGTISGNQASAGGGIYTVTVTNYLQVFQTTIASNNATNSGGGIYVGTDCGSGTPFSIDSSVVVSNTATFGGANFYAQCPGYANSTHTLWGGPFDEFMNNIGLGDGDKTIIQDTVTTEFFPLSNTGSPYFLPAYPLRSTSDAVNQAVCYGQPDVRGVSRPQGLGCDSGAWEI
jgi:predicted outer membrane repeat protein